MAQNHSNNKILLTGGSGLLGTELRKRDKDIIAPLHAELDVTDYKSVVSALKKYNPDVVIHAAAITKPPEHEKNPEPGITVNIIGTANVSLACFREKIRLVYLSSDYVYTGPGPHKENESLLPPSKFIWSKLGGECSVILIPDSLTLRLSFGTTPYQWEKVYDGQFNSKLYVDEIAPLILMAARSQITGVLNVGGPRTSLADYARRTKPNLATMPKPDWVPRDTSLNISRMSALLGIDNPTTLLKHPRKVENHEKNKKHKE